MIADFLALNDMSSSLVASDTHTSIIFVTLLMKTTSGLKHPHTYVGFGSPPYVGFEMWSYVVFPGRPGWSRDRKRGTLLGATAQATCATAA